jgi:hypothetical protein
MYSVVERRDKGMPKKSKEMVHFKIKLLHRFSGLDQQEVVVQDERTSKNVWPMRQRQTRPGSGETIYLR